MKYVDNDNLIHKEFIFFEMTNGKDSKYSAEIQLLVKDNYYNSDTKV
jgi:hypothetical protein